MASVNSELENARVGDRSNFREGPPHELFRRLRSECPVHWSDGITLGMTSKGQGRSVVPVVSS